MRIIYILCFASLGFLGGCSKTVDNTALDDSDLPWGRPADWEKTMPVAPGVRY